MTKTKKEKLQNFKRWAIAVTVTCLLVTSCAITINNVNHSNNVQMDSEQNASQQNDSTLFNTNLNR